MNSKHVLYENMGIRFELYGMDFSSYLPYTYFRNCKYTSWNFATSSYISLFPEIVKTTTH